MAVDYSEMSFEELHRVVIELVSERQNLLSQLEDARGLSRTAADFQDEHARLFDCLPSGILILDREGRIQDANLTAASMLGVDKPRLIGAQFEQFVSRDSQVALSRHLQLVFGNGGKAVSELKLAGDIGSVWSCCLESRIFQLGDQIRCCSTLLEITTDSLTPCNGIDVSELQRNERRLLESESRLASETEELARLNEASTKLWRARDLQAGLREILVATIDLLKADAGLIQLYQPTCNELRVAAQEGLEEKCLRSLSVVSIQDESILSLAVRRGHRVMIDDLENIKDEDSRRLREDLAPYRSVQATPLFSGTGEILGVCSTYCREPRTAEVEQLRRFDLYLRQAVEFIERQKFEQLLSDREERMAAVLEAAADAIVTVDRQGIIEEVNSATEKMFGYSREELLGQNVSMLMPSPYREEHDEYLARYVATRVPHIIGIGRELFAIRKDGTTFPVGLSVSEVDHKGLFTGILRDNSERHKLQREVLRIADEEQGRIGQDLHDSTQQELAGLGMLAHSVRDRLVAQFGDRTDDKSQQLLHLVDRMIEAISRTHREVQVISRGLVALSVDPQSLMHALRNLAARVDELDGTVCGFKCEEPVLIRNNEVATHLFRIAQEAVTNALKHAHPEHLLISLESLDGFTELRIADDGRGFEPHEVTSGLGLKTMDYRASLIGAQLSIAPVETGGTLVTCKVWE